MSALCRWDLAVKLLQQMQAEGIRPSSACLTSAVNACLQGEPFTLGWTAECPAHTARMKQQGLIALCSLKPLCLANNAACLHIACSAGGQAARAEQLFDRLCSVCKPDASTFNCLVCVYCRLGKVREAANMLEIMLRSGQHVDATAFDAAIDACWGTGVLPLQQFAQQLLERAQQQGLYQKRVVKQVGDDPWPQPDASQPSCL